MKNSLKLMFCIMFAVFFSGSVYAVYPGKCGPGVIKDEERKIAPSNFTSNTSLKNNAHVAPYIPNDLAGNIGTSTSCDEDGSLVPSSNKNGKFVLARCFNYQSTTSRTSWRIRYSNSASNKLIPMNESVATEVFKMTQSGPVLWVSFTGRRTLLHASADAQKFTGKQGGNTEVAENPDGGNQENAQITKEEIVKQGVGAVIEGLKGFKGFKGF